MRTVSPAEWSFHLNGVRCAVGGPGAQRDWWKVGLGAGAGEKNFQCAYFVNLAGAREVVLARSAGFTVIAGVRSSQAAEGVGASARARRRMKVCQHCSALGLCSSGD